MGLPLQLIGGLSDEKVRWQDTVENLENMLDNISGDVLVASGFVAYLGPFTVRSSQPCLGSLTSQRGSILRPHLPEGQPVGSSFLAHSFNKHLPGAVSELGAVPGTEDIAVHERARKPTLVGLAFRWEM